MTNHPKYITTVARKLRSEMTFYEKLLWEKLKDRRMNGLKFVRQKPFGRYIVDFYCKELNLAIELEGSVHKKREQKVYDKIRFEELQKREIRYLRINNDKIKNDVKSVLNKVSEFKNVKR